MRCQEGPGCAVPGGSGLCGTRRVWVVRYQEGPGCEVPEGSGL